MQHICPNCEKITDVQHIKTDEEITVKGERINVPVEYYKCLECGDEFDDPKSKYDPLALAYNTDFRASFNRHIDIRFSV